MIEVNITINEGTSELVKMPLRDYLEICVEENLPFDNVLNETEIRDSVILTIDQLSIMPIYQTEYAYMAVLAYFGTDLWEKMISFFTQESILIIIGKYPWISKTFQCVDPLINNVISITR